MMPISPSSRALNNEACSLVKVRRYEEAYALLKEALCSIKVEGEALRIAASSPLKEIVEANPTLGVEHRDEADMNCPNYHFVFVSMSDTASSCIYAKLVYIRDDGSDCLALRAFAITFNLALASHFRSIELERDGKKLLSMQAMRQSRKLYLLALQVEGTEVYGVHLSAAAFNNLSQICRSLGNDEESRYYDHLLLSNLILLIDIGIIPEPSTILTIFLKNVSYLLVKCADVAAAA
jgi:hypothetical protein